MAPSVPEALKKKRVAHQAALAKRALAQQNAKKANVIKRRAIIKVRHHKDSRNSFINSNSREPLPMPRNTKTRKDFWSPARDKPRPTVTPTSMVNQNSPLSSESEVSTKSHQE